MPQPVVAGHPARAAARDHRVAAPLRLPRDPEGAVRAGARGSRPTRCWAMSRRSPPRRRPFHVRLRWASSSGFLALVPAAPTPGARSAGGRLRARVRPVPRRRSADASAPGAGRTADRAGARPSGALGLSLRAGPVPLPHDPDRAARRAGAGQGQGHPRACARAASWRSPCVSTSWRCSPRRIGWRRSASSPGSRSAADPRPAGVRSSRARARSSR